MRSERCGLRRLASPSALIGLLAIAAPAPAGPHYRYVHKSDADVYFGHISYCELKQDDLDPRVVRGEATEAAVVNVPLAPGDRILTPGGRRCEAQFDTGTIVRLDGSTGLRIQTLLAPALSSSDKLTNLQLETGRLRVMYRDYDGSEVFQVLTSNAAVKIDRDAVVEIAAVEGGATSVRVERGRVVVLYGARAARTESRKLKAGEAAAVLSSHLLEPLAGEPAEDAFTAWNRDLDERFVELHAGRNKLPKPVYRYPPAVIHFAERWSSDFGEWVWTDLHGYAWRPYRSRDEGWRPYMLGRWTRVQGRLFWVSQELWGWVPYHLGQWHWDKRSGWVWYPGSLFAPAWVTWTACENAYAWQPYGLWDWLSWNDPYRPPGSYYGGVAFYATRFSGYSSLGLEGCGYPRFWTRPVTVASAGGPLVPSPEPTPQPSPGPGREPDDERPRPPKEVLRLAERFAELVKRGDPEALESVRRGLGEPGVVRRAERRDHASAPEGAAAETSPPTGTDRPATPAAAEAGSRPDLADRHLGQAAATTADPNMGGAGLRASPPGRLRTGPPSGQAHGEGRFRDWNPDVRAARAVGGRITYDSARNVVRCEDCRHELVRPSSQGAGSSGWSASSRDAAGSGGSPGNGAADGSAGGTTAGAGARGDGGARDKKQD